MDDEPVLRFASRADWRAWLEREHAGASGLWIEFAKKNSGVASVTHAEALEEALSFGWIDARVRRSDDPRFFCHRFTPRAARSKWSQVNREAAEALIAAGAMRPAGLREVQRAQADGRWAAAYAPQSTASVPPDLQVALDAEPRAAAFFATLDSRNRYAVLHRIADAKRPETRARRIATFVAMLAAGEKLHP
jgi:uncharacterized protein YdeI (YjbR/CyaY-like superfamily)